MSRRPHDLANSLRTTGSALPAFAMLAIMVLWAAHNGGYDADTWYWGALSALGLVAILVVGGGSRRLTGAGRAAIAAFALYVAWSYLSISWAASPGDALEGSNRALLYLLVFTLFALSPWTATRALAALLTFTLAIGIIGLLILAHMAGGMHVGLLFSGGRLVSPTGYFNSSAALFMFAALLGVALATRRELPALLRGVLLAIACGSVQLALLGQSRGWLFTLPVVLLAAVTVTRDRFRAAAAAVPISVAALANLSRLLDVYHAAQGNSAGTVPTDLAQRAGSGALITCAGILVAGTLLAAADQRLPVPQISITRRRVLGVLAAGLAIGVGLTGATVATHGHPIRFIQHQWHGFTHPNSQSSSGTSHFADVGSSRYDFWRVSLDAFLANPIGGLGQDNFVDYYLPRRRGGSEPKWTHSLEFRLLTHTGLVGAGLFLAFLAAAVTSARRRRTGGGSFAVAAPGLALLPLIVWLVHGSVDWFWETPALTGPALGFLAMAGALGTAAPRRGRLATFPNIPRLPRPVGIASLAAAFLLAVAVLGIPYLSVRELSLGNDLGSTNPVAALDHLASAADLNPLSPAAPRLAGYIALQQSLYNIAEQRFHEAIDREPGGWFDWLGDGLAASALGDPVRAYHDFKVADSINSNQPAVAEALSRVYTSHPLTPAQALKALVVTR